MTTKKEIFKELEYEIQYMASTTQNQYRSKVSDYLDWVAKHADSLDMWKDKEVLNRYVDYLKHKRHLSQPTINFILRGAIGTLFRMQQPPLRVPVKLPKMTRSQMLDIENRKHFSEAEINQLIATARHSGNLQWQNLMALSSIYMLRAGEITNLQKEDVHPLKKTFLVHTEKGGLLREHYVPPVIAPYIFKYSYPPLEGKKIHFIFREIADAAGVSREGGRNIHAVRHGVFTTLKNLRDASDQLIYSADDVFKFGRWAGGTITETYNHPEMLKNDERIFKHHPFLQYWK
jgi:integrase